MPEADLGITGPYVITGSGEAAQQYNDNGIHYAEKGGSSGDG